MTSLPLTIPRSVLQEVLIMTCKLGEDRSVTLDVRFVPCADSSTMDFAKFLHSQDDAISLEDLAKAIFIAVEDDLQGTRVSIKATENQEIAQGLDVINCVHLKQPKKK